MRGTPIRLVDFHGGVNTKANPYLVAQNECRDCRNVVSTIRGSIKKRNGNQTYCSSFTGSPANLYSLAGIEVTGPVLIATGGSKIYSISGGVASDITGAASLTSNLRWETIEAPTSGGQGPVYMMNGTDTPKYWTGSGNIADWTVSGAGSLPNGKYVLYFRNRVFVAGVSANPSRLFASGVGDPRSWDTSLTSWAVDLDPNDGDVITGLGTLGPYLLVFKRNKIFRIFNFDTGANVTIATNLGASSHRSIVESPIGVFFLTNDKGVYLYNGSKFSQVSEKITPTVDNIIATGRDFAAGAFYNNHYYLSIPTNGSTNDLTLDYDIQLESWWFHTNTANQFALWKSSSQYELYAIQAGAAIVDKSYASGVLQDNGSNFQCYWDGPWLAFNEPYRNKRMRQIHVDGQGQVDAYISKDYLAGGTPTLLASDIFSFVTAGATFGGSGTFGGTGTFGDQPSQSRRRLFTQGVARAFSVRFAATSSTTFEMDSYTPYITLREN